MGDGGKNSLRFKDEFSSVTRNFILGINLGASRENGFMREFLELADRWEEDAPRFLCFGWIDDFKTVIFGGVK